MNKILGKPFGRWTVVSVAKSDGKNILLNCRCECGTDRIIRKSHLISGESKSCGCWRHGRSRTRTYLIWIGMKQRCLNPKSSFFFRYGGRGIRVCRRWERSFENFLADMGECPPRLTIDRKNNDGNYCKRNCRWASAMEQASNTSRSNKITWKGQTHHASKWARIIGIPIGTLNGRVWRGLPIDRILSPYKFVNQHK